MAGKKEFETSPVLVGREGFNSSLGLQNFVGKILSPDRLYFFADYCVFSGAVHCTKVRFPSFLSVGFITMAVMNPLEKKLEKRTSVHCVFKWILCEHLKPTPSATI